MGGIFGDTGVQYCWGKGDIFPLPLWGLCGLLAGVVGAVVYAKTAPDEASPGVAAFAGTYTLVGDQIVVSGADMAKNVNTALGGTVLVTLGWIVGFFNNIYHQIQLKLTGNFNPDAGKLAERIMMNGLEQGAGAFLMLLWLHALFVDTTTTVSMGWCYVIGRWLYAPLYTWYGHFTILVELVTMPNYMMLAYFFWGLFFNWYTPDTTLISRLNDMHWAVLFPAMMGLFLAFMVCWAIPVGAISGCRNSYMNPFGHEDESDEENGN